MTNPRLTLRLAVTGHRPPIITPANEPPIRANIRAILSEIASIALDIASSPDTPYDTGKPALRILSSLAEGSDRLVAEVALALNAPLDITLQCPLPAARAEYRQDFKTPASQEIFDNLLAQSKATFELDGQREVNYLRATDYHRAGHIAISNCDLLIAIWDKTPGSSGGTAQIAQEAMASEIPVIRIDPAALAPIEICASRNNWTADWKPALKQALHQTFDPPKHPKDPSKDASQWLRRYHAEWPRAAARDPNGSDALATRYGHLYRASYWSKYALSTLAVWCAVASLLPGQAKARLWPTLEFVAIAGILACFALASKFKWHERWLDYRLLAEQFRVFDFLQPLAETVPIYHPPTYWGAPPERHSCVRWYFRARLRELSLPNVQVTPAYIRDSRKQVLAATRGQFSYNWNKHQSAERRHRLLESGGIVLFGLTAAACIFHLNDWGSPAFLGAATAALPALATAMEGLQAQEESKRIAGYTKAMSKHLEEVETRIEALPVDAGLGPISTIAFDLATEMTRETSGWHNLIHGQPPRL